jgi:hypothetical protein
VETVVLALSLSATPILLRRQVQQVLQQLLLLVAIVFINGLLQALLLSKE